MLLAMAARFPRTLEGLLLFALPPAAAELLLSKLETADALPEMRAQRAEFYAAVYSPISDSRQLLGSLLRKKERVAELACRQVASEALGFCCVNKAL